jgi:hypothetical protein
MPAPGGALAAQDRRCEKGRNDRGPNSQQEASDHLRFAFAFALGAGMSDGCSIGALGAIDCDSEPDRAPSTPRGAAEEDAALRGAGPARFAAFPRGETIGPQLAAIDLSVLMPA